LRAHSCTNGQSAHATPHKFSCNCLRDMKQECAQEPLTSKAVQHRMCQLLGQPAEKVTYTALENMIPAYKPVKHEMQLLVDQCFATCTVAASRWLLSAMKPTDWLMHGLPFLCVTHNSDLPQVTAEQYSAKEISSQALDKVSSCPVFCSQAYENLNCTTSNTP
jgi:BarA-like signal transduction histidine kinase